MVCEAPGAFPDSYEYVHDLNKSEEGRNQRQVMADDRDRTTGNFLVCSISSVCQQRVQTNESEAQLQHNRCTMVAPMSSKQETGKVDNLRSTNAV